MTWDILDAYPKDLLEGRRSDMTALTRDTDDASQRSVERLFSRDGIACAAVLAICLLLTWPVAQIGINDDWCYGFITWNFARTGHLAFYGWASPLLGWQAIWGGIAARIFGSTFTVIRLSLVPVSLGTALIYHAVLRNFGLNRSHAVFGALTFVLGPVFVPMADIFMTDIPSVFAILLCLYFCQLALAASKASMAMIWLANAALTNIALGTVRQIAWLGVLVIVPCCGWLLRKRRGLPILAATLWLTGVLCIFLALHWFNKQPYTAPEQLIAGKLGLHLLSSLFRSAWRAALTVLLLSLPVLAAGLPWIMSGRRLPSKSAQAFGVIVVISALASHKNASMTFLPPWMGNVLSRNGLVQGGSLVAISPLSTSVLLVITAFFLICSISFLNALLNPVPTKSFPEFQASMRREMALLLLPFLSAYCLMLLPRSAFSGLYDRYLLAPIFVGLVYLLRWHQRRISTYLPWPAYVTLGLFTVFAVASTHDLFAMERARVRLLNEVQAAGVQRTSIRGDFEFDAVTEVQARGYVNDPRIVNPANAYQPQPVMNPGDPCFYWFGSYVPAIHADYAITSFPASPCFGRSSFPPVSYRVWLPPGSRQLFVGTVPR